MTLSLSWSRVALAGCVSIAFLLFCLSWSPSSASASPDANATTSALKPKKNCRPPQPQPPFNELKVRRVSCAKGRSIARSYLFRDDCYHDRCIIQNFKCNDRRTSYEGYRGYCHRGNMVVRFDFGY